MTIPFQKLRRTAEQLVAVGGSKRPADLDLAQLAAWTTVANVLFNLDETMTKRMKA